MDPARREQILGAARGLGAEAFNRLVESVEDSVRGGRLRYWQEDVLGRLPGVGPVSFAEFLGAFGGAVALPVPRRAAPVSPVGGDTRPTGRTMTTHPRLGPLTLVEEEDDEDEDDEDEDEDHVRVWEAAAELPSFAARGVALRGEDDPPPGKVWVRVQVLGGAGVAPEQEAAIARLLDHEPEVFAAVWAELTPEFAGLDPDTQVICTEVVVSWLHVDGVAHLGFTIQSDSDIHGEHGFQVVYHPTRGTAWGDWEAVNGIVESDN